MKPGESSASTMDSAPQPIAFFDAWRKGRVSARNAPDIFRITFDGTSLKNLGDDGNDILGAHFSKENVADSGERDESHGSSKEPSRVGSQKPKMGATSNGQKGSKAKASRGAVTLLPKKSAGPTAKSRKRSRAQNVATTLPEAGMPGTGSPTLSQSAHNTAGEEPCLLQVAGKNIWLLTNGVEHAFEVYTSEREANEGLRRTKDKDASLWQAAPKLSYSLETFKALNPQGYNLVRRRLLRHISSPAQASRTFAPSKSSPATPESGRTTPDSSPSASKQSPQPSSPVESDVQSGSESPPTSPVPGEGEDAPRKRASLSAPTTSQNSSSRHHRPKDPPSSPASPQSESPPPAEDQMKGVIRVIDTDVEGNEKAIMLVVPSVNHEYRFKASQEQEAGETADLVFLAKSSAEQRARSAVGAYLNFPRLYRRGVYQSLQEIAEHKSRHWGKVEWVGDCWVGSIFQQTRSGERTAFVVALAMEQHACQQALDVCRARLTKDTNSALFWPDKSSNPLHFALQQFLAFFHVGGLFPVLAALGVPTDAYAPTSLRHALVMVANCNVIQGAPGVVQKIEGALKALDNGYSQCGGKAIAFTVSRGQLSMGNLVPGALDALLFQMKRPASLLQSQVIEASFYSPSAVSEFLEQRVFSDLFVDNVSFVVFRWEETKKALSQLPVRFSLALLASPPAERVTLYGNEVLPWLLKTTLSPLVVFEIAKALRAFANKYCVVWTEEKIEAMIHGMLNRLLLSMPHVAALIRQWESWHMVALSRQRDRQASATAVGPPLPNPVTAQSGGVAGSFETQHSSAVQQPMPDKPVQPVAEAFMSCQAATLPDAPAKSQVYGPEWPGAPDPPATSATDVLSPPSAQHPASSLGAPAADSATKVPSSSFKLLEAAGTHGAPSPPPVSGQLPSAHPPPPPQTGTGLPGTELEGSIVSL